MLSNSRTQFLKDIEGIHINYAVTNYQDFETSIWTALGFVQPTLALFCYTLTQGLWRGGGRHGGRMATLFVSWFWDDGAIA
jgi:hypothetical protein